MTNQRDASVGHMIAIFNVRRVWKGDVPQIFEMPAKRETGDCEGFVPDFLRTGVDLLVYAFNNQGRYSVASCSRTNFAATTKDFRELGPGRTADSESTERVHPGWQRGIRIGSLKDGKVTTFIPPHMVPNSADGAMGEGIAIDAAGNVYTAEAQLRGVTKYVRK